MKVVEAPSNSNNGAFAGVLTRDYPARTSGMQIVELYLPGGCAMVAQRVASTINTGLVTCAVGENDSGVATLMNGVFGHGGFRGRGSAIPLETLAAATLGDLAFQNVAGTAVAVYSSSTGLTTITMALAGTALGYVSAAIDASDYEMTVWGGATAADGSERCPSGVYPVVQATAAGTFTVTGDTGDGALTMQLTKKNMLRLAYLCDGPESGLSDYYIPDGSAVTAPILDSGMTIALGGIVLDGDCEPVIDDGTIDGQRKGFYMLGTVGTNEIIWDITSGYSLAGTGDDEGTALAGLEMNTAEEWSTMEWHGHYGPSSSGTWMLTGKSGTSVACT